MAIIRPFRGLRYNPDKISFISRVITPPYDVINPKDEVFFRAKTPHNFIRLGMGKTPPEGRREDEYRKVSETFRHWQEQGVLIRDESPSVYVLEQSFQINGKELKRRGLIAALMIEELGHGSIHPHENTMSGPKDDRIKLIETCGANLSQPMMMHSDPEGKISSILENVCKDNRFLYSFRDEKDIGHTFWRIEAPDIVKSLSSAMQAQSAVIADGHHRYESALAYRNSHRPENTPEGEAAEDYLPAFMVSIKDNGLVSLPTHRAVDTGKSLDLKRFFRNLKEHFAIEKVKINNGDLVENSYDRARKKRPLIGCVTSNGTLMMLRPLNAGKLPLINPAGKTEIEKLPVKVLHGYIFPSLLGIKPGSAEESNRVEYNSSASDIYWNVQSGKFDIGFLLPHTPPQLVQKVAERGERLPVKSTYFYPKIPSGLIIYPHEN